MRPRDVVGALALASIALAGCIAPATDALSEATAPAEVAATPSTTFSWRARNLSGPAAVEVAFAFPQETDCEILVGATRGPAAGSGTAVAYFLLGPGGELLGGGSGGGALARAYAGPADTDALAGPAGQGATSWGGTVRFPPGSSVFRLFARELQAWDNSITEGDAAFLDLDCKGAFQATSAAFSDEAIVGGLGDVGGGVGARVMIVGGASAADEVARAFASERVAVHAVAVGTATGRLVVTSPADEAAWSFAPQLGFSTFAHEARAGEWVLTLDGASAYFGWVTLAAGGFSPLAGPHDLPR